MFVPFSSYYYYALLSLIDRLDTAGFSDLLASYSIFFQLFVIVLPSHLLTTLVFFLISALVSSTFVIIGSTVALYNANFVSFLIYLFHKINSQ